MASLVQDVWLDFGPRLRARRLAPWSEAPVRVVFCPDRGATLDDEPMARFLEKLAERLEVIAWEPRGQGASAGRFGPEVLDEARRLVVEIPRRWGATRPLVFGGHGLGGWLAFLAAEQPAVAAAFALAPSVAPLGPEPSTLRDAVGGLFDRPPLPVPTLLVDWRGEPAEDEALSSRWLAHQPLASRLQAASPDLLAPPWDGVLQAWVETVGREAGTAR